MDKQLYPSYIPTEDGALGFVGRWFTKEINRKPNHVTVSDGSEFYFMTDGASSFKIDFTVITTGKTPYFAYSVDGAFPVRRLITDSRVKLADKGKHTVRIITDGLTEGEGKWTDEKGFAFTGVSASEGTVTGIRPVNKIAAFYGDSITEGIRALSMDADSDGNSATHSFPFFCCAELGAVPYNAGYGATGIVSTGSFNICIKAIDFLTAGRPEDSGFNPDLIVINHGSNDSSCPSDIFSPGYAEVVERLHTKHPLAHIFAMIPFCQTHADDIRAVCSSYKDFVTAVETSDWAVTYTDGVHPDAAGAETAGIKLADVVLSVLGSDFFGTRSVFQ